ncbi:hypothetical protein SODALDRAFT_328104, partial [Sodiomyces alkalinus F11]
ILLSSSIIITYTHYALIKGDRGGALYVEYSVLSFTISFHGFHVIIGIIFLAIGL